MKLENIKAENINNMMLVATEDGNPAICVITNDGEAIKHPLLKGFDVHEANEFLRSLGIEDVNIEFNTYRQYGSLISTCAEMLRVQRIMKKQRYLGKIPATEVHDVTIDMISDAGWNASMMYVGEEYLQHFVKKAAKAVKKHYRKNRYVPMA